MIKTINQFAKERNITSQGVRQLKRIDIRDLPLYAKIGNSYYPVTDANNEQLKQKFVVEK